MPHGASSRWSSALVYALVLVSSLTHTAIVPLLPHYASLFGLGAAETGALVAAPGLTMLAVAAPAGLLGDRIGAGRLLLAGGALVAASSAGQALADSFPVLLGWRVVFGAAFALVWTAGPAWLSQTATDDGETRVGATMTYSAVGVVVGPVLAGLLAEGVAPGAPFWVAGAVAGLLTTLLAASLRGVGRPAEPLGDQSLWTLVRATSAQPAVRAGAAGIALSGAVTGVVQLLAPLALSAEGSSSAAIGLAFSAAAGVYIAASASVLWAGSRAVSLPVLALAALGCAVALSPAAVSASSAAVMAALLLFSAPRAALSTIVYPLATREASRAGLGESGVLGLLNAVWAAATVAGPLAAGALAAALGTRAAFLVTLSIAALVAAWIVARPAPVAARLA